MNKLIIGSAQMGMNYGISNNLGKVRSEEAKKIIEFASNNDIKTIDTAINYGSSEKLIGNICDKSWHVITKIPSIPQNSVNIRSWVEANVCSSLKKLNKETIDTILIHNPDDIHKGILPVLEDLKKDKLLNKIGISIYNPETIHKNIDLDIIDVIQCPYNIFDRRIISSGLADNLKLMGIEIHARSIFLQGLLLMDYKSMPKYFNKWKDVWLRWKNFLIDNDISSLDLCINNVQHEKYIDKYIVGVESKNQLEEILKSSQKKKFDIDFDEFKNSDMNLINPTNWVIN